MIVKGLQDIKRKRSNGKHKYPLKMFEIKKRVKIVCVPNFLSCIIYHFLPIQVYNKIPNNNFDLRIYIYCCLFPSNL